MEAAAREISKVIIYFCATFFFFPLLQECVVHFKNNYPLSEVIRHIVLTCLAVVRSVEYVAIIMLLFSATAAR